MKSQDRGFFTPDIRASSGWTPDIQNIRKAPNTVKIGKDHPSITHGAITIYPNNIHGGSKADGGRINRRFSADFVKLNDNFQNNDDKDTSLNTLKTNRDGNNYEQGVAGSSSFPQACFNSINILMGVGVLSLPYSMREAGWFGLIILVLMALMTG